MEIDFIKKKSFDVIGGKVFFLSRIVFLNFSFYVVCILVIFFFVDFYLIYFFIICFEDFKIY